MPEDPSKTSRTGSTQALEILAWHLNFFPNDELSINEISKSTGLAWATVKKFSEAMELISNISPTIMNTKDGIKINSRAKIFEDIFTDDLRTAAFYLFMSAKASGKVTNQIILDEHARFRSRYEATIQKLIDLELVRQVANGVQLTAAGLALTSDIYSWINEKMTQPQSELSINQFAYVQGTYSLSEMTIANGLDTTGASHPVVTTYITASGAFVATSLETQQVNAPADNGAQPFNAQIKEQAPLEG